MRKILHVAIVVAVAASAHVLVAQSGNDLFQKALSKERAEGQLNEAIQIYERIVKEFAADRPLAAKALLQIGRAYERLGKGEAQKAYERLVREYTDQRAPADEARARLAALRARLGRPDSAVQARGMSSRQVWTLPGSGLIYGTVSHDGRYLPYTDWAVPRNGELFLHDIASGTNRQITHKANPKSLTEEFAEEVTFSPDDTQLAYAWFNKDHDELRIIGLQAPDGSRPRVVFSNSEVPRIVPQDWSSDGKWLAVQLQRKDKTAQIGLIAVQDGSLRVLKSVAWRGSTKLFFSPDGKYLAYDLPTVDTGDRRDVFVLAIDGSREAPAVVHPSNDVLFGWSPDGTRLLFTSDRTGSTGLWALTFVDGKPRGAPEQIKVDVAGVSMGLTRQGTLYSFMHYSSFTGVTRSDIHVAEFDFTRGQFLSTPVPAVPTFDGANNFPAWSPDGKHLAFLSARGEMVQGSRAIVIMILSHDTGQLREVQPQLNIYSGGPGVRWSPDGRSLAIQARDAKGRRGLFRIDATTGEAVPIALSGEEGRFSGPVWSADGKRLYYSRVHDEFTILVERDLASGDEKEIIRRSGRTAWLPDLSPDGQYWAAPDGDWVVGPPVVPGRTRAWTVVLIPAGGGAPKELMRMESQGGGVLFWAPDSLALFVYSIKDKSTGEREVWRVPIDGTLPQRLDLNVNFLGPFGNSDQQFHAHPDGKRVAFAATERTRPEEVWVLENFLPTAAMKAGRR